MLKCAQNPFVLIASIQWTSNVRLTLDIASAVGSSLNTCFKIGRFRWERQMRKILRGEGKKDKEVGKMSLERKCKGSDWIEMIENIKRGKCYIVNRWEDCSTYIRVMQWIIKVMFMYKVIDQYRPDLVL